jgi:hypothetical protein
LLLPNFGCQSISIRIGLVNEVENTMNPSIIDQVFERLKVMPQSLQQQVLEFTRTLADSTNVKGVSGSQLLRFAGTIPLDDLNLMNEAINQDCEQVDINEW